MLSLATMPREIQEAIFESTRPETVNANPFYTLYHPNGVDTRLALPCKNTYAAATTAIYTLCYVSSDEWTQFSTSILWSATSRSPTDLTRSKPSTSSQNAGTASARAYWMPDRY